MRESTSLGPNIIRAVYTAFNTKMRLLTAQFTGKTGDATKNGREQIGSRPLCSKSFGRLPDNRAGI